MSQPRICIIDYGLGNIRSLANALKEVGVQLSLSSHREEILEADGCILPGVGAFAYGMHALQSKALDTTLRAYAHSGKPLLGICLGMQLMMESSEEFGSSQGLGLIPGDVLKLGCQQEAALRLPHVCWNDIVPHLDETGTRQFYPQRPVVQICTLFTLSPFSQPTLTIRSLRQHTMA